MEDKQNNQINSQTDAIMAKDTLDYIPHDELELPSGGKYRTKYGKSLKVAYMDSTDENILFTPNLVKSNKQIEKILKRKILDKTISLDDILSGDLYAIMVWLRTTSLSNQYTFTIPDPTNEYKPTEFNYVLNEINYKKNIVEPDDNGLVTYKDDDNVIKYKYLTTGEEKVLDEADKKRLRELGDEAISTLLTDRLIAQIQSVNGITSKSEITEFVHKKLSIKKSRELRRFIVENEPGIDTRVELISPATKEPFRHELEFGYDIFYVD